MKSARVARTRHLSRRRFERTRKNRPTQALYNFWSREATRLAPTAALTTFNVTIATDRINAVHGLVSGQGPLVFITSDTLPTPLTSTDLYWPFVVTGTSFTAHLGKRENVSGTPVDITDLGVGTQEYARGATIEAIYHVNRANKARTIAGATDIDDLA